MPRFKKLKELGGVPLVVFAKIQNARLNRLIVKFISKNL
jgi:hypothetical protein